MARIQIHVPDENAMINLAKQVARYAEAGDFIALSGTLGMGKSTFARGFIRALANQDDLAVPSPTFTLMQPYDETRLPVAHVDAYRMEGADELYALHLEDMFDHGVVLMEWPEKVAESVPEQEPPYRYPMESEFGSRLDITITESEDGGRTLSFAAWGSWPQRMGLVLPEHARAVTQEGRTNFLKSKGIDSVSKQLNQDCSFRTYHRVMVEGESRILMDAPAPMENAAMFQKMQAVLKDMKVRVPEIYEEDLDGGYLLLEDFGGTVLRTAVQEGTAAKPWLKVAVELLADFANRGQVDLPWPYGAASLWQEACRYTDWYLPAEVGHATDVGVRKEFQNLWYKLYTYIEKLPRAFSHWDFHVDNLMLLSAVPAKDSLGVIDFQDARCGSIAFDLSCLLEDRFPSDEATKQELIDYFLSLLKTKVDKEEFMVAYRICVAHRFLKITGLLERLERRDMRVDVKGRMPQVWATIRWAVAHPVLTDVRIFLETHSPEEMGVRKAS